MGNREIGRRATIVWCAVVVGAGTAAAQSPEARTLAERFGGGDWTGRPGCAVASFRDGHVDYFAAFGLANLELGVPIDRNTVFNVGSVSKQFTAYAVGLLAERRQLHLDDGIGPYLPWMPDYGTPITVRHLLTHTSGLRDYVTLRQLQGIADDMPWSAEEARALLASQASLNYPPGTEYQYSNSGFFALGEIVRAVSGKSLPDFAREEIFEPLGMRHTRFLDDHAGLVPGRADAYEPLTAGGYRRASSGQDVVGAGGVLTTIDDMAIWDVNLAHNTLGLGAEFFSQMTKAATLTNGRPTTYGFGLTLPVVRGVQLTGHNGQTAGYNAVYMRAPLYNVAAIALCNSSDAGVGNYIQQILDAYLERYMEAAPASGMAGMGNAPAPVPTELPTGAEVSALAGSYVSREVGQVYEVAPSEGGISFRRAAPNGSTHALSPISRDTFRSTDRSFTLRFVSEEGVMRALFTTRSGRVRNLVFERRPPTGQQLR